MAVAALGLWGWNAADRIVPSALGASLLTLAPDLGLVAGVGLALWLVLRFVVGRFITVPAAFVAVLVAALVLLMTLSPGASRVGWWALVAVVLVGAVGLGTSVWGWLTADDGPSLRWPRSPPSPSSQAPSDGSSSRPGHHRRLSHTARRPWPPTGDPGRRGSLAVKTLTYGSGTDRLRPEYAGGATLTTKPVDLSRVITGWTGDSDRTRRWGFDAAHIPLNA